MNFHRPKNGKGKRPDSGRWGEDLAARFLRRHGYRLLGKRVRVDRRDELDLVAVRRDVLVFVEVKTRRNERFGSPISAVNREKRRVLSRAAVRYLRRLGWPEVDIRFDVIEVIGEPGAPPKDVRHHENVFPLDRRYRLPM